MSKGYVYILSNPSMPGLVKIGKTTNPPGNRAAQLHTTGVPTPFVVERWRYVPDCGETEQNLHEELDFLRVSDSREFFRVDVESASKSLDEWADVAVEDVISEYAPEKRVLPELYAALRSSIRNKANRMSISEEMVACGMMVASDDEIRRLVLRAHFFLDAIKRKENKSTALMVIEI